MSASFTRAAISGPASAAKHPRALRSNLTGVIERFQYLPRRGYTPMPWRNGAGTTLEIAREPAHAAAFEWRLSLASVAVSGPFSSYPGYHRAVALIEGRGFRLDVKDELVRVLAAPGDYALFPGAAETACGLIDGPCTDLSLMVREPGCINMISHLQIGAEQSLPAYANTIQALFIVQGSVEFREHRNPKAQRRAPVQMLNFNDTLVIYGGALPCSLRQASCEVAELLIFSFAPALDGSECLGASGKRAGAAAHR
jgi:environmental stress-induced protein Ves